MKFLVFFDHEKVEPRCLARKCFQIKPTLGYLTSDFCSIKCSTFDNWIRKSNDFLKNSITLINSPQITLAPLNR